MRFHDGYVIRADLARGNVVVLRSWVISEGIKLPNTSRRVDLLKGLHDSGFASFVRTDEVDLPASTSNQPLSRTLRYFVTRAFFNRMVRSRMSIKQGVYLTTHCSCCPVLPRCS